MILTQMLNKIEVLAPAAVQVFTNLDAEARF